MHDQHRYGDPPEPVQALLAVAAFRLLCREHGVTEVVGMPSTIRFAPAGLPDSRELRLKRMYPGTIVKESQLLVPRPTTGAVPRRPVDGLGLLEWATQVVTNVYETTPAVSVG
jgi:transcription-repair coupling factor (superfamily II helicase)